MSRESGVLEQAPLTCGLIIPSTSGRLTMTPVRGQWWRVWLVCALPHRAEQSQVHTQAVLHVRGVLLVLPFQGGSALLPIAWIWPQGPWYLWRWTVSIPHSERMLPYYLDHYCGRYIQCSQDFRVLGPQVHSSCLKQKFTLPPFPCQSKIMKGFWECYIFCRMYIKKKG